MRMGNGGELYVLRRGELGGDGDGCVGWYHPGQVGLVVVAPYRYPVKWSTNIARLRSVGPSIWIWSNRDGRSIGLFRLMCHWSGKTGRSLGEGSVWRMEGRETWSMVNPLVNRVAKPSSSSSLRTRSCRLRRVRTLRSAWIWRLANN